MRNRIIKRKTFAAKDITICEIFINNKKKSISILIARDKLPVHTIKKKVELAGEPS